eukprot:COSAG01_NODE_1261_length_11001_cov_11.811961_6_plen_72_part_00
MLAAIEPHRGRRHSATPSPNEPDRKVDYPTYQTLPRRPGHLCTASRASLDRRGCAIRTNCGGDLPPPPGES